MKCLPHSVIQRKIGDARQIGIIAILIWEARLPPCRGSDIGHPCLTDDVEPRILVQYGACPLRHVFFVWIGMGVHADAVDTRKFDPPQGVLNQVLGQERIALIQIRHFVHKPSFDRRIAISLGRVRIHDGTRAVVGVSDFFLIVHPIGGWQIVHHPMVRTHVVMDHVHDHFEPFGLRTAHQFAEFLIRSEAAIHFVHVGCGVPVIKPGADGIIRRHVVFEDRRHPDGGHAQIVQIIEAVGKSFEVATMTCERLGAIGSLKHAWNGVVRDISICKSVGHEQIDHVRCVETVVAQRRLTALKQRIVVCDGAATVAEHDRHGSWFHTAV